MEEDMADIGIYEPVEDLYFEDHLPGSVQVLGSVLVTEEEIIAFAKRYDPQVFHVDPEAAKATSFGGLVSNYSGSKTVPVQTRQRRSQGSD
jgi:acyl dehydratase